MSEKIYIMLETDAIIAKYTKWVVKWPTLNGKEFLRWSVSGDVMYSKDRATDLNDAIRIAKKLKTLAPEMYGELPIIMVCNSDRVYLDDEIAALEFFLKYSGL
jgi:hypothetical protein